MHAHTSGKAHIFRSVVFHSLLAALASSISASDAWKPDASGDFTKEPGSAYEARMGSWEAERFGMFIHFGLYSIPAGAWDEKNIGGYAEWIQANADIPAKDYATLATQFNPAGFNAEAWVLAAKHAGMKYLVITTKHHDGFCLWPTKLNRDWNVATTPFKRDILGELSAACQKHGIRFGTYYSITDWHHPAQFISRDAAGHAPKGSYFQTRMHDGRKAEYVAYMKGQIAELIQRYDTDILWFDGDWVGWWTTDDGKDLYNYIRSIKPSIIINNRVSKRGSFKLDFGTPENETPGAALNHKWEACWTMNNSWGFKSADKSWKSPGDLIQKLIDINSKGGNLLLNVGPTEEGLIPQPSLDGLASMGEWLKVNGPAIYGSTHADLPRPAWGRITRHGAQQLFLHVFNRPADGVITVDGIQSAEAKATLLADGRELSVEAGKNRLQLTLPADAVTPPATVIALTLSQGWQPAPKTGGIALQADDKFLPAAEARISGQGPLKLEAGEHLGYWRRNGQEAGWSFELVLPGDYEVYLLCAAPAGKAGGKVELTSRHGKLVAQIAAQGKDWNDYQLVRLGTLKFPKMARESLAVEGVEKTSGAEGFMNLKGVVLRPVAK